LQGYKLNPLRGERPFRGLATRDAQEKSAYESAFEIKDDPEQFNPGGIFPTAITGRAYGCPEHTRPS